MQILVEQNGLKLEELEQGAIWRVLLATPKANILDMQKCSGLMSLLAKARERADLKAILIEGEGAHFSFGASVEEHLPASVRKMLGGFHTLLIELVESGIPTVAVVRGQCLGGGLELALVCSRIFAAHDACFGQPEIKLGLFAPTGSLALPERVGRGVAEDLLLTGRSMQGAEAARVGLVDELSENPLEAALAWCRTHLLPKSAASLRFAQRAARADWAARFRRQIRELEQLYLEGLMNTHDANEGLTAFLEKRPPQWRNA